ncbi:histone transcription regulator 1 [Leucogyrophana mollusca]|uniref:Histone transcription regulator 1 n=1 Tax=Leucogyrophana mollusca TaxID=85980 RepID=A0ACB8B0Y8_9AGAM|nr:histone transcription regulator 1 [Leucogyrophana mollusca]
MRFTKPSWVMHKDSAAKGEQDAKRLSIFSVHVHPDGSRIATGGLDAKIRIWSTKPIINHASELSNRPPKALCTLSMHTGPVLTVRWAYSGRWLASGSDDEIVMIWDLDPSGRGKVFGSNEVNVEGWKPMKRLPGHESDVTDVAWSPEDRYLASVGLDSQIIIWCGYTLERIRKLDQHQGFVKGVCWDPVGEFLATQSDDKSVKIWRTIDWELEAEIRKPFEDSPGSTFFRRLSWSPDGAHITASNATNNKGMVFIAAVITRGTWTSEISLVGHENTVEVAAYNPHIFLRNPAAPVATSNICSVVALGADDRSVSIWQTKSARPLIVAREVFERQIMDLSWSWDGLTLYAASSDGTLAVFHFEPDELEGIAPHSAQEQYLQKFGFTPPPVPEGYSHGSFAVQERDELSSRNGTPARSSVQPSQAQSQAGFGIGDGINGGEQINRLVAKKSNKKRVQPILMSSVPSAATSTIVPESASAILPQSRAFNGTGPSRSAIDTKPLLPKSRQPSHSASPILDTYAFGDDVEMIDTDVPIEALDTSTSISINKGKRKASALDLTDDRPAKPRTLGGDRPRESIPVREIGQAVGSSAVRSWGGSHLFEGADLLQVPPLLTFLSSKVEGSEDVLEGKNSEGEGPTEVTFSSVKQTQWLDFLPSPIIALTASNMFCAVALQDGSVNVYSHTGRRLMPTLSLGSPCSFIHSCKSSLMILTASGQLHSLNVKKQSAHFPPISVAPLLSPSPNCTIQSATVRHNGAPIIQCSSGVAYSYDPQLSTWIKLSERWWSEGSSVWQGRQRANKDIIATIEGAISTSGESSGADKQRPQWWNTALTLGHLESKLHAAKALDSPAEYKQALLLYAKNVADEGFRGKAEELIKELFGPVFWRPGRDDGWSPTIIGMSKRDLLREVLLVFARSKTLTKLAQDWQDTLKKASNDEHT